MKDFYYLFNPGRPVSSEDRLAAMGLIKEIGGERLGSQIGSGLVVFWFPRILTPDEEDQLFLVYEAATE